jgi:hypothetical protein
MRLVGNSGRLISWRVFYFPFCYVCFFQSRRWIFQSVDTAVEKFVDYVDTNVGAGHGHRVCTVFQDEVSCGLKWFLCRF